MRIPYRAPCCGQGQLQNRDILRTTLEAGLTVPLGARLSLPCVWTRTTSTITSRESGSTNDALSPLLRDHGASAQDQGREKVFRPTHNFPQIKRIAQGQGVVQLRHHIISRVALLLISHLSRDITMRHVRPLCLSGRITSANDASRNANKSPLPFHPQHMERDKRAATTDLPLLPLTSSSGHRAELLTHPSSASSMATAI